MKLRVGQYKIHLSEEVISLFRDHIQYQSNDHERGGIILGIIINDYDIHVLKISSPTSLDKSSRTTFERHKLSAQFIINYEFLNSNGQIIYLGEWHTHPETTPIPSETDMNMIHNQFNKNKILTPFLLLIIQGIEKTYLGIYDGKMITSILI